MEDPIARKGAETLDLWIRLRRGEITLPEPAAAPVMSVAPSDPVIDERPVVAAPVAEALPLAPTSIVNGADSSEPSLAMRIRSRESVLRRLHDTLVETHGGFAFFAADPSAEITALDGETIIEAAERQRVNARAVTALHRIALEQLSAPRHAADPLESMDESWAAEFERHLSPVLSTEERAAWSERGSLSMLGFVTDDGSVLAWTEQGPVLRSAQPFASARVA